VTSGAAWTLDNFDTWLARWRVSESADDDLQIIVADWIMTRVIDPFKGAEPTLGQPDLLFAWIPGSGDGCGSMVCCSYRVDHATHTVTCDLINSLSYP
jgi:hypothetical protein